jgi:hypothetical protein
MPVLDDAVLADSGMRSLYTVAREVRIRVCKCVCVCVCSSRNTHAVYMCASQAVKLSRVSKRRMQYAGCVVCVYMLLFQLESAVLVWEGGYEYERVC